MLRWSNRLSASVKWMHDNLDLELKTIWGLLMLMSSVVTKKYIKFLFGSRNQPKKLLIRIWIRNKRNSVIFEEHYSLFELAMLDKKSLSGCVFVGAGCMFARWAWKPNIVCAAATELHVYLCTCIFLPSLQDSSRNTFAFFRLANKIFLLYFIKKTILNLCLMTGWNYRL